VALKTATAAKQTPFVFASVGDPGLSGLTPKPGGNYTGGSNQQVGLAAKRVDHMLRNPIFLEPFAVVGNYFGEVSGAAMTAAYTALLAQSKDARLAHISPGDDVVAFIKNLKDQDIKSAYVVSDLYLTAKSTDLNKAAHQGNKKIRTMWEFEEHHLKHGGDDYYGLSFKALFEKAAEYVDQIVTKKKKAGDLPLFTTTKREGLAPKAAKAAAKPGGGKPAAAKGAAAKKKR
jgi:hypothetical protein